MNEEFWLEYQIAGKGIGPVIGSFADAAQAAFDHCHTNMTVVNIYNAQNRKIAQQTLRGLRWVADDYREMAGVGKPY